MAFPRSIKRTCRRFLVRATNHGDRAVRAVEHSASLRIIFDLAEKYGIPIDVHCDEIDDEQSRFVELMAAFASKRKLDVPVTASHAVAMAYYNNAYMAKLTSKLIAAQLNFTICANENLQLQGWGMVPMRIGRPIQG